MKVTFGNKLHNRIMQSYSTITKYPFFLNSLSTDVLNLSSPPITKIPSQIKYTKKEQKAYDLVKKLFEGKFRKDKTTPYFKHCEFVGNKLKEVGYDENVVAAGFLHDVVEDIKGWTLPKIKRRFGQEVATLVGEVSHKNPDEPNWVLKTRNYISHLKTISPEGMTIAACDKMSSLNDDIDRFYKEGLELFDKLGATPKKQLQKHRLIYTVIMTENPPKKPLAEEYKEAFDTYHSLISNALNAKKN